MTARAILGQGWTEPPDPPEAKGIAMSEPSTFRERAGVLMSAVVVLALVATGPLQMGVQIFTGAEVHFDATWLATVSGLAGTAFGFLIGKQSSQPAAPPPPAQ